MRHHVRGTHERIISDYLIKSGVRLSINGFEYIAMAIELCLENEELIKTHGILCKIIADSYNVNLKTVERAIYNAVKTSYEPMKTLNCKEFVARAVYDIKYLIKDKEIQDVR